jgi:hypothetical protein
MMLSLRWLRKILSFPFNGNLRTFFLNFPIYLQSVYIHNTISKLCVEKRGRVEECSVAPLRDERVKTLCGRDLRTENELLVTNTKLIASETPKPS